MPKAVREVKSFNLGIVTAADDNDIKIDAATYSQDIDPNSTEGRLRGRWDDMLIDVPHFRNNFVFTTPSEGGDGDVTREINITSTGVANNTIYQNENYRFDVNLVGTIPTGDVTIKIEIDDFSTMSSYAKINDTNNTSGYPNSGEYIELVFTSGNWNTIQTFYLIPQNVNTDADIAIKLNYIASSGDSKWNSTDVDYSHTFAYESGIVAGLVIRRSTFKNNDVNEGEQEEFRIDTKLSVNPNFADTGASIDITYTAQDPLKLKADYPDGGSKASSKTLSFTNANYDTYQTIYPYPEDDGVKNGNSVEQLIITGDSNGNGSYGALEADIATIVRYDDGNFVNNDFIYAGLSSWNFIITEASGTGSDDDGSGDGEKSEDKGWDGP